MIEETNKIIKKNVRKHVSFFNKDFFRISSSLQGFHIYGVINIYFETQFV